LAVDFDGRADDLAADLIVMHRRIVTEAGASIKATQKDVQ
jgi:hypothetical protein